MVPPLQAADIPATSAKVKGTDAEEDCRRAHLRKRAEIGSALFLPKIRNRWGICTLDELYQQQHATFHKLFVFLGEFEAKQRKRKNTSRPSLSAPLCACADPNLTASRKPVHSFLSYRRRTSSRHALARVRSSDYPTLCASLRPYPLWRSALSVPARPPGR